MLWSSFVAIGFLSKQVWNRFVCFIDFQNWLCGFSGTSAVFWGWSTAVTYKANTEQKIRKGLWTNSTRVFHPTRSFESTNVQPPQTNHIFLHLYILFIKMLLFKLDKTQEWVRDENFPFRFQMSFSSPQEKRPTRCSIPQSTSLRVSSSLIVSHRTHNGKRRAADSQLFVWKHIIVKSGAIHMLLLKFAAIPIAVMQSGHVWKVSNLLCTDY